MNTIKFPDYKKWYKENKAVWNSIDYGKAQFKLQYHDRNNARLLIKRREDSSSTKPNLMLILERMNKFYTKNGDRINESTDWIHYFYNPADGMVGMVLKTYKIINPCTGNTSKVYRLSIIMKLTLRKEHILYIQKKKILLWLKKKIHF